MSPTRGRFRGFPPTAARQDSIPLPHRLRDHVNAVCWARFLRLTGVSGRFWREFQRPDTTNPVWMVQCVLLPNHSSTLHSEQDGFRVQGISAAPPPGRAIARAPEWAPRIPKTTERDTGFSVRSRFVTIQTPLPGPNAAFGRNKKICTPVQAGLPLAKSLRITAS